jgi:hypothetical protein
VRNQISARKKKGEKDLWSPEFDFEVRTRLNLFLVRTPKGEKMIASWLERKRVASASASASLYKNRKLGSFGGELPSDRREIYRYHFPLMDKKKRC